jgi:hypothetical protein
MTQSPGDLLEFYKTPTGPWQVFNHSTALDGTTIARSLAVYVATGPAEASSGPVVAVLG